MENLTTKLKKVELSGFPTFQNFATPLERGLWVLWVAKDKLDIKKLTAQEIVTTIIDLMEVSITVRELVNAFNRADNKIHISKEGTRAYYEIMKAGKDYLSEKKGNGSIEVWYFEPGKKYSSKITLTEEILRNLKGELKIVDPYCASGTLILLSKNKNRKIKCLTRIENLSTNVQQDFLKDLKDFKTEFPAVEFRSYPKSEIHDRYILSDDSLVILGHSLKDLGAKESFAIVLSKDTSKDTFDALLGNFNRRWKSANLM